MHARDFSQTDNRLPVANRSAYLGRPSYERGHEALNHAIEDLMDRAASADQRVEGNHADTLNILKRARQSVLPHLVKDDHTTQRPRLEVQAT